MQILIADDNIDGREALSLLLAYEGHEVITRADGPAALDAAHEHRPHAAILDIGMPGMTGYEVAEQIRQSGHHPSILLIALSGWGREEDKARARAAGFDHHFTKPVDIKKLLDVLAGIRP